MKPSKSLFQLAAKKYTSFSAEVSAARKVFLEELTSTQPTMDAAGLNQLYSGNKDKKPTPASAGFSSPEKADTSSNPGGSETPAPVASNTPGNPAASPTPADATAGDTMDLTNPNLKVVPQPDGSVLYIDPANPTKPFLQSKQDAEKTAAAKTLLQPKMESIHVYTTEDIMSALNTLAGKTEALTDNTMDMSGDETTSVGHEPAGDTLIGEEDDEDGSMTEAMPEPATSTSSEISSPSDGTSSASSSSTGSAGSASSFMPTETEEKDRETGVDDSYTTESEKEKGAGEAEEETSSALGPAQDVTWDAGKGDPAIAKGAGTLDPTGHTGETAPELGEQAVDSSQEGNKESAFWIPNDDIMGLKDIVGDVSKGNGVPNTQENIVKDPATGALVKKPTMPAHAVPNMRQYVKTNGVPGAPSVLGGQATGQPVDISDLDSVMGMDPSKDKALNISLNFNF